MKPTLTLACNNQVIQYLDLAILHDMLNPRPGEVWRATVETPDGPVDFFDWLHTYASPLELGVSPSKRSPY